VISTRGTWDEAVALFADEQDARPVGA